MKKILSLGALTLVLPLALTACNQSAQSPETPTSQKVVRIATESNFKPFSYLDNQGKLVGFEIDLANALCKQMQVTCQINSVDWDGLIPALNANQADAVMAGMSITPDRLQVVNFSDPYFNNTLVLVAKKDNPATIADIDGKTVATQQATVSAKYLSENHPKAVVKTYDKQDNAYLDLSAGRAEFMLSDVVPMMDWLKSEKGADFEVKGEPIDIDDKVAIAMRKDDTQLATEFNTALKALKDSGEYDKIVAQYFDLKAMGMAK